MCCIFSSAPKVSLIRCTLFLRTVFIFFIAVILIMFVNCGIGLIMYAYYHQCDPVKVHAIPNYDKLLPHFVQRIIGHIDGMSGLFIACLFCSSLSAVSPILHSLSGILYKDCIRPLNLFTDNDQNANFAMRIIIFAIGTYCALSSILVETFHSAFQLLNAITSMTTGAKVGVFTLGLFWPWTNINVNILLMCFFFSSGREIFQWKYVYLLAFKGLLSGTLFSMLVVFSLIVNAQYHTATGELKLSTMPTSIKGCFKENFTQVSQT